MILKRNTSKILVLVCFVTVFRTEAQELVTVNRVRHSIGNQYDNRLDTSTVNFIMKYKVKMDIEMSEIIGQAPLALKGGIPESPLLNLTSDVIRLMAGRQTNSTVDIAFMNSGGLRSILRAGEITVGNIFEIYPFDNKLVILNILGKDLKDAFDAIAQKEGSGVSNVQMEIEDRKIKSLQIGGKPLDENRIYSVATIDYLAEGNDDMTSLLNAKAVKETNITLRDIMLQYIRDCNRQHKPVTAANDGRITIIKL